MATAALEAMPMALSPRLDALKASPLSASAESLQLNDYLDFGGNASATPSSSTTSVTNAPASSIQSPRLSSAKAPSMVHSKDDGAAATTVPPPPGSAPEVVFRYYLKLELRKMGSPADDATIDRYVQQHYDTFLKAMDKPGSSSSSSSSSSAALPASSQPTDSNAAQRSTPTAAATKSSTQRTQADESSQQQADAAASSSVHAQEDLASVSPKATIQPFKVPPTDPLHSVMSTDSFGLKSEANADLIAPAYDSIDPHLVQFGGSSAAMTADSDAMSEDGHGPAFADQEDSKDGLAPLISSMRFGSAPHSDRDRSTSTEPGTSGHGAGGVPPSIRDSAAANLRPTAEEYRALSSKEKRQLRNKISARNFRERRKEYITHLEGEISDRDALISSLRQQLSNMSLQNKKLEDEVKTLQARSLSQTDVQKILEALQNVAVPPMNNLAGDATSSSAHGLRPSAPYDVSLSSAGVFSNSRPSTPSSPRPPFARRGTPTSGLLPQHNPRKDLPTSAASASAAAAGSSSTSQQQPWSRGGPTVAASA